ncbi:lysozyme inhibitor LprI family protein [Rhizobium calliandrae]|uniref:Lysozyme inhibitor LprI family protein n=1 Tax=Rhizobium calliandrae TaxID=1312182 RepID=A0ABT7K9Q0_9HYPH|nr:lysozyme inhibitor LprI family protein [Rhizobium calliandrae]MDL2405345.1 lysozyme inhibitor LprI family protein [Rhizobium calliandrae]
MLLKVLASSAFVATVLMCGSANAQNDSDQPKVDCNNAQTQMDMNICAQRDYDEADKALNEQYKRTRAAMVATDADLDVDQKGAEEALIKAERAWVDYRDGQCEAEGFEARGGSMEPMLVSGCKATLTKQRTEELKTLADGPEGAQ